MTDLVGDVRRRATSGVRSVIVLNLATFPLSFATNLLLGRVSADALGYYGAVTVLINSYYTFAVLGGSPVFTRFVPALPREDRPSFLMSYAVLIAATFLTLVAVVLTSAPAPLVSYLERMGLPSMLQATAILAVAIPWGFSLFFLYATLRPTSAVLAEKTVIILFFLVFAAGTFLWRERFSADPAGYVWSAALWIHCAAAGLAVYLVARTSEFRQAGRWRWLLPPGFWSVASYTSLSNLINYVYSTLTPTLVLVWLEVSSLGHLHAAFRYVVVLDFVPAAVAAVLAPSLSQLEASGFREQGFGQVAAAVRTTLLLTTPVVLGLILFSGDAMAVFGPEFREHGPILAMVAISALASPTVLCGAGAAAAVGAFRSYLAASMAYVVVAVALTVGLVPWLGLWGAALAVAAGALVRQTTILLVLRPLGLPGIPRIGASWFCALGALGLQLWLAPSRGWAALLWVGFTAAFAGLGRVTPAELRVATSRLLGRE